MDRVKLGLEKAYRGWGIPGHLYSRQGEILAAGQEEQFALPRELLAELFGDEWAVAQAVREATQAALHSMDNMAK